MDLMKIRRDENKDKGALKRTRKEISCSTVGKCYYAVKLLYVTCKYIQVFYTVRIASSK